MLIIIGTSLKIKKRGEKMKKWMVILGVILAVLGLIITIWGFAAGDSIEDIKVTEDGDIKGYDPGDEVTISGEITDKVEFEGVYIYQIDDYEDMGLMSSEDLGDKGDSIYATCEVVDLLGVEVLEVKSTSGLMNSLWIIGIVILIIGIVLLVLGFLLGKKKEEAAPAAPPEPAPAPEQPPW